jgi:DNA-binding NarL/FixJ family response regulator
MTTANQPLRQYYLPLFEAPRPAGETATVVHLAVREAVARQRILRVLALRTDVRLVEGPEGQRVEAEVRLALIEEVPPSLVNGHAHARTPKLIAIGEKDDERSLVDALGRGAWGYLRRQAPAAEMCAVIKHVAAGRSQVLHLISGRPESVAHLMAQLTETARPVQARYRAPNPLTGREGQILACVADGETGEVIAGRLHLGVQTVKNHLTEIYQKTKTKNRTELVATAIWNGWVEQPEHPQSEGRNLG